MQRSALLVPLLSIVFLVPMGAAACRKTTRLTPAACEAFRTRALSSAQKASDEATNGVVCHSNADCVAVGLPSCIAGCNGYAAASARRSQLEQGMRAIADGDCKRWAENECATIAPQPIASCANYVPACKSGHCTMRDSREVLPTP